LDNGPSEIGLRTPIMLSMTSTALQDSRSPAAKPPPRRSAPAARRLVLVPATHTDGRGDELVRRYRLARLRLETREVRGDARFAHLTDFHD
jgi:hypothetical protein